MTGLRKIVVFVQVLVFFLAFITYAKTVYILNFNDFHSMLYNNKTNHAPGMVFFMNAILSEIKKDKKENVILVSGGDNYQGTIVSYDTKGAPVNDIFRAFGVTFSAVGNHEFDWGQEYFNKWEEDGNFSYLVSNIFDKETLKNPPWADPYKMIKIHGIKIAFIGLTTLETKVTTSAKNFKGLKIIDPWISAQYWIDYLKAGKDKEGIPDVVVALTHIPSIQDKSTGKIMGEEINNLCLKTKGLDVVISGHSHETVCGEINGVLVIQDECYGKKYGIVKIGIDDTTGKVSKIESKVFEVPVDVKILPENTGERILVKYSDIEKKYSKVIGKTETDLPYDKLTLNALGVYIAKLMAESANSQIAFINGLWIRRGLERGDITLGDIFTMSPFDSNLVCMKLSGKSIKAVLEHGFDSYGKKNKLGCIQYYGLKVKIDSSKPVGQKVISMALTSNDRKIKMDEYYSVCTNDFLISGGDNYKFEGAKDVKIHSGLFVRDILIDRIKKEKILMLSEPDCLTDLAENKRPK